MKKLVAGLMAVSLLSVASVSFAHDTRHERHTRQHVTVERIGPPFMLGLMWRFGGFEPVRVVEKDRIVYRNDRPRHRWWKRKWNQFRKREARRMWRHERRHHRHEHRDHDRNRW